MFDIREDDLAGERTRALLALHLRGMHANSPPGQVFSLDLSGLQQPDVTVWSVWESASLAGIGALKPAKAARTSTQGRERSLRELWVESGKRGSAAQRA